MNTFASFVPLLDVQRFLSEDFFTFTGLTDLSEEEQNTLIAQIAKAVLARTYVTIVNSLPVNLRVEFSRLPDYEMVPFAEEHGINIGEIIVEEGIRFRAEAAQVLLATEAYQVPYGKAEEEL